jgi:hypothetical protein
MLLWPRSAKLDPEPLLKAGIQEENNAIGLTRDIFEALTANIIALARNFESYGCRKIAAFLQAAK